MAPDEGASTIKTQCPFINNRHNSEPVAAESCSFCNNFKSIFPLRKIVDSVNALMDEHAAFPGSGVHVLCTESSLSTGSHALDSLHTEETNKAQNNQWLETLSDAFTGLERPSGESFSSPARRFYYIIHPQRSTQSSTVTKSRLPRKFVVFSLSHFESGCHTLPLVSLHRLEK